MIWLMFLFIFCLFPFSGIRQLQCILLKVALIVGVEIHVNVGFIDIKEPTTSGKHWIKKSLDELWVLMNENTPWFTSEFEANVPYISSFRHLLSDLMDSKCICLSGDLPIQII